MWLRHYVTYIYVGISKFVDDAKVLPLSMDNDPNFLLP